MLNLLEVESLSFGYSKNLPLFEEVSFSIGEGEALGLLGDSGCGKSTLAKCLMQILKIEKGKLLFEGRSKISRTDIQIIFQDSASSLNPSLIVHYLLEEPIKIRHPDWTGKQRREKVGELLNLVGLKEEINLRLSDELSGGQRQRVNIARALALEPKLLVLDEPVSQLDCVIQNAILKLLVRLQKEQKLSLLLISHDVRVLKMVCHRILKMEKGRVVPL